MQTSSLSPHHYSLLNIITTEIINLSLLSINKIFLFLPKMSLNFDHRREKKNKQQQTFLTLSACLLMTEKKNYSHLFYILDLIN
jgi:hypothetical protein